MIATPFVPMRLMLQKALPMCQLQGDHVGNTCSQLFRLFYHIGVIDSMDGQLPYNSKYPPFASAQSPLFRALFRVCTSLLSPISASFT